ncbi:MAG TPA: DEAD/DEAH box helicase [Leptospiraceae bacterium]|nr:DEAD/DEAH box helicase [Leptospiraceae bacterium]HNF26666.1 DEAD/DEAH box helicase [Leptospiraceae bacterium]HNI96878.1 DEAD/DEAH box helicase [Leptospiraceae bacterium]HNM04022.1 DEAD/DEAH box helicase [Leptospiraceae bacterium]HNN06044.1 DEAD/DEAH box helicase [Leptospiraceae bacterium]
MNLSKLFSRADDEFIQEIVGSSAIEIIRTLFPEKVTPSKMKELVFDLYRENILLNAKSRSLLFQMLKKDEAAELMQYLQEKEGKDPYTVLQGISFSRKKENLLLKYFELPETETGSQEEPKSEFLLSAEYPLFPHQRNAIAEIKAIISGSSKRVILHMPTGAGKTRTTMSFLAEYIRIHPGALVVWLAASEELCEQASDEFQKAWKHIGDRDVRLYKFWGRHTVEPSTMQEGLMVAGLSKMFNMIKNQNKFISALGTKTKLVVMDEAHQAVAKSYSIIINSLIVYNNAPLIGLTATPGRSYSDITKDEELAEFFHRRKVTLKVEGYANPIHYLQSEGYLAKTEFYTLGHTGNVQLTQSEINAIQNEFDIPEKVLVQLGKNEIRNIEILKKFRDLITRHRRIMFFAASVEHSEMIAFLLRAMGIEAYSVSGKTSSSERNRVIQSFKDDSPEVKVICNFGVLTTGFDAPKTSCAFIARPTNSLVLYSQMVGRAIRGTKQKGNDKAEIITVIDTSLPGFRDMAEAFLNWEDIF